MPKLHADFPEQVVVRLTTQQRVFIDDLAELHRVKGSAIVRAIIEDARVNHAVDHAIATIDHALGPIEEVGAHAHD